MGSTAICPNKLADYHAAGKPVIMVGDSGNNSVKESGAGFVVKSIEGLPDAIEELINSTPEERKRIEEKGRAFAKEYYD